jgi:glycosidase
MNPWPKYPVIYEINTWVWLHELSVKCHSLITLKSVPEEEWDAIGNLGMDAVWFMGVWERSPAGISIANKNEGLLADFRRALPDYRTEDNVGSPYCVRRYEADPRLGGREGLAAARQELAQRGIRLILDFVPNHVAPDHPWVDEHPDYFIQGDRSDLDREPASFVEKGGRIFACGRDPYFPAWPDVLQLNAFQPGLRQAVIETLSDMAGQCDGVRCDMAMLLLNNIFERTWGQRAGAKPETDYWPEIIPTIKRENPDFKFIAEAYWDLEWELQQQSFDFCYDKKLYDRMEHGDAENVRLHLLADLPYQEGMVRFIENHDEPRAAATFPDGKGRAAAVAILTLTGAKLLHEGQFEGMKARLPVFLGRRPKETRNKELLEFYHRLLGVVRNDVFRNGSWQLCERTGWPDNQSFINLIAYCWLRGDDRYLIVVNFSDVQSQGNVKLPWDEVQGKRWHLVDVLSGSTYERTGDDMMHLGLYIDLEPWSSHLFRLKSK